MINEPLVSVWLDYAKDDLETAIFLLKRYPQPFEHICYHSQQSAEKALKAFLLANNELPDRTHDLNMLCKEAIKYDSSLASVKDSCSRLNAYSVQPRYPFEISIVEGDMKLALRDSGKIYTHVESKFMDLLKESKEKRPMEPEL